MKDHEDIFLKSAPWGTSYRMTIWGLGAVLERSIGSLKHKYYDLEKGPQANTCTVRAGTQNAFSSSTLVPFDL